ncbi:cysteine peptidase family C39 domain-containing protein [Romeriopsis navalis]|nr:cysteine peptidase family C39 domain-containing protein [Romeriopsis navalis]
MVLLSYGKDISEQTLREACDSTPLRTDALKAIDAARALGFLRSHKATLSTKEAREIINDAVYPIIFLNLLPIDGIKVAHAMVLQNLDDKTVQVINPLCGERHIPRTPFEVAWAMMRNLAILVL